MEQEKSLPGVVMALVCNVFDMLYQLANLEEPRITLRVRKLLLLIPTDPAIQEALDQLDSLGRKVFMFLIVAYLAWTFVTWLIETLPESYEGHYDIIFL